MGMIKTERELKLLKKSVKISDSCIPLIKRSLHENISERELARRIRRKINQQGAALSFQTLVASGKRTSMIHPKPYSTNQKISGIGYVDFGASYKGYKTDVTVPFVKGKISKEESRVIDSVLHAYRLSVKAVKVGEPCWKAHEAADNSLRKNNFKMQHALGHGLGLKVHESPTIVMPRKKLRGRRKLLWERTKKITFQPNMVFTIEPGVYTKKFGCRIENDFLIGKNKKLITLTHSKLIEI